MPSAAVATTSSVLAAPPFRHWATSGAFCRRVFAARAAAASARRSAAFSCQVAFTTEVTSSPPSNSGEGSDPESKVGSSIRVKIPLQVYHVSKAPDLNLFGLEGVIKQYVGIWKGKRISANLPFKVEFNLQVEGQSNPVRFFAHLREDEFEYI